MHIVILGNPVDGLTFHGPFHSHEAASRWAEIENSRGGAFWWTARLEAPPGDDTLFPDRETEL